MMRDIAMMKNDYVDCPAHMVRKKFVVKILRFGTDWPEQTV